MTSVTPDQLSMLTEVIVREAAPRMIILFGSQARETANEHSDVDLLIVKPRPKEGTWSRRRELGALRRSLPPIDVPVDLLLFTPEEFAFWKETTNHVAGEAARCGKVLYERP